MKRMIMSVCILVFSISLVGCGGGVEEGMPANPQPPGPPADLQKQMEEQRNQMKSQSKRPRAKTAR